MKTIWQRLDPQIVDAIEADAEKWPFITSYIKQQCNDNYDWGRLDVEAVAHIVSYSHNSMLHCSIGDFRWGTNFLTND